MTRTKIEGETSGGLGWGMVFIKDVQKIMELTGTRQLLLRDSAVFMALIAQADWKTGHINTSQQELADLTSMRVTDICATIKRLSQHHLVRRIKAERGVGHFYAINPYVVAFGKENARGALFQQFQNA